MVVEVEELVVVVDVPDGSLQQPLDWQLQSRLDEYASLQSCDVWHTEVSFVQVPFEHK